MCDHDGTLKNLNNLSREMTTNGYPNQELRSDGKYHRFPLLKGGKGVPGYYLLKKTASGYWAVYGDFVSNRKYIWSSCKGKQLPPEEAEKLKSKLANEAKEFEAKLKRKHEKGAMAARYFWETGRDADNHLYLLEKTVKSYGLRICDIGYRSN